ncbi:MAG TPA: NAD(P)-binding domain-containing protein [Gaiellaceae bacterium]|nr:NAD(P)-binding domain-containing protein [Gaiellaceae bacterium]
MLECVVIGAGQAGLATSYHLTRLGVEHLVLERSRVAETWRAARWDSFCLNTPNWCTQLPGLDALDEPDAFAPLADVISLLTSYADHIGAPVRSTAAVTALRRRGAGFELTVGDDAVLARSVVVATGAFQRPTTAPAAANVPEGIVPIHAADYRRPTDIPEGGVLVVGSGQSGCEIGQELLESGRPVHLAIGRCGWAPRRYRGRELMRWMVDVGLMNDTSAVLPSTKTRIAGNVAVSGSRGGRDCNPLVLEAAGAKLYGRLVGFDGARALFADDLAASLDFGLAFERDLRRRFDAWAEKAELDLPEHPGSDVRPARESATELALARAGISTVLWASGYRPAFGWIDVPIIDDLGFPLATRGVTDVPGLTFVGLPWLYTRKSPLLLGVGEDAEHIAQATAAHLAGGA